MSDSDFERGFQKGFEKGLEEGKKLSQPQIGWPSPRLDDFVFGAKDKCSKCGIKIDSVMGYVCSNPNCPTFIQTTYGPGISMTGAVGSTNVPEVSTGVNGPAGPAGLKGPSTKEERERLDRYNQVWINGTWATIGN